METCVTLLRCLMIAGLVLAATMSGGCSNEPATLINQGQVTGTARDFQEAWLASDVTRVTGLCRLPFRYKDKKRIWSTDDELRQNVAKEIPRKQHLLKGNDRVEAFSYHQLMQGEWPRAREVPAEAREAALRELGVEPGGWLVRLYAEGKPGFLLTLNLEGSTKVRVQGMEF